MANKAIMMPRLWKRKYTNRQEILGGETGYPDAANEFLARSFVVLTSGALVAVATDGVLCCGMVPDASKADSEPNPPDAIFGDRHFPYNPKGQLFLINIATGTGLAGTETGVKATQTLTSTGVAITANDTVTIGTTVYTFKAAVGATAGEVLIGANAAASLENLKHAINLTGTPGTNYGSATVIHPTVTGTTLTATTLVVEAKTAGLAGNAIATTETAATLSWGAATMAGGLKDASWTSVDVGSDYGLLRPTTGDNAGCQFLAADDTTNTLFRVVEKPESIGDGVKQDATTLNAVVVVEIIDSKIQVVG